MGPELLVDPDPARPRRAAPTPAMGACKKKGYAPTMNKVMAALFIGLAGGGAIGALVGAALLGSQPPTPDTLLPTASATTNLSVRRDAPREVAPAHAPLSTDTPAVARAVRDLIDDSSSAAWALGEGSITGQITDIDGQPVAGVTIRATRTESHAREPSTRGSGPPAEPSLEDVIQDAVRAHQLTTSGRHDAVSDEDGRYRMERLPEADFRLQAWKSGFSVSPRQSAQAVRPGATLDFNAVALHAVRIDVRLPDGSLADRAIVSSSRQTANGSNETSEVWSRAQPELLLEAGYYAFTAMIDPTVGDYHRLMGEMKSTPVDLDVNGDQQPLTLHLSGRRGIRGRVTTADGIARDSAIVRLRRLEPGEALAPELLKDSASKSTWIRRRLEYEFLDLEPGRYGLGAGIDWNGELLAWVEVEVQQGLIEQDIELPELSEQNALIARVTDANGRPVPSVRFRYELRVHDRRTSSSSLTAIEQAPGEYWLIAPTPLREALWDGPAIDGTASIIVSGAIGKRTVAIDRGQHRLDVQFDTATTVMASVAGYTGSGLEGLLSLSLRAIGSNFETTNLPATSEGPTRIGPIEVGEYEAVLILSNQTGTRKSTYEISRTKFLATAPETQVAVSIPPLYTVTVVSNDADKGTVNLSGTTSSVRTAKSIEGGQASLELIPAGEYRVDRSRSSADGRMTISVPSQTHVVFHPLPQNTAVISIRDGDGHLAKAGFAHGDAVISIGGMEFNGANEWNLALAKAVGAEGATAKVLREGTTITLPVDAALWLKGEGLGGSWKVTYAP